MRKRFSAVFLLSFFLPLIVSAITPVSQYNDLVAGEGEAGYRDGPFYRAQFNHPSGLALSADGTKLYVADRDNHCLRQIDLENNNEVSTLAGTGKSGTQDGSLLQASFEKPLLLLTLPENRLLVYDEKTLCLRLLDLNQKQVSTFFPLKDLTANGIIKGVFVQMTCDPKGEFLYFTQGYRAIGRINLKTKESSYLTYDPKPLPNPAALGWYQGQLCVTNAHESTVFLMNLSPDKSGEAAPVSLSTLAKGDEIVSLFSSDKTLYAFQAADSPWVKLAPKAAEVRMMSVWGSFPEDKSKELDHFLQFNPNFPPGVVVAPGEAQRFFVAEPQLNCVMSLRDYSFWEYKDSRDDEYMNPNGLRDFTYPVVKPPHTFRILLMGDSHLYYEKEGEKRLPTATFNRQETVGKKLEAMLNFEASLQSSPWHYQVLTLAYERYSPIPVWAYIQGPKFIEEFDVDMALLIFSADFSTSTYFEVPYLKKEGIPNWLNNDSEFRLAPMSEKLAQDPVLRDFYERCVAHDWVKKGKWGIETPFNLMVADPNVRKDLSKLCEKPLGLLRDKLHGLRTKQGKPIDLHVLFMPLGVAGGPFPNEAFRGFWEEVCKEQGLDFTDLMDPFVVLRTSAFPSTELWGFAHFDQNGHSLFSYILAREIFQKGWLPPAGH